jgi:hypothetical protein
MSSKKYVGRSSDTPTAVKKLQTQITRLAKNINQVYHDNENVKKYLDIIHKFSFKILQNRSIFVYDSDYLNFLNKKKYVLSQLYDKNNKKIVKNYIIYLYLTIIYRNYAGTFSRDSDLVTYFRNVNRKLESKFSNAFTYLQESKKLDPREFEIWIKNVIDKLLFDDNLESTSTNLPPENKNIINKITKLIFNHTLNAYHNNLGKSNYTTKKRKPNHNQTKVVHSKRYNFKPIYDNLFVNQITKSSLLNTFAQSPHHLSFAQSPLPSTIISKSNHHENYTIQPNVYKTYDKLDTSTQLNKFGEFNDTFQSNLPIENFFNSLRNRQILSTPPNNIQYKNIINSYTNQTHTYDPKLKNRDFSQQSAFASQLENNFFFQNFN